MNKKEKEALRDLSDKDFMDAWTKRSKEAEEAKEDCRAYAKEHQRRMLAEKIEAMPEAERDALHQFMVAEGVVSQEGVNGG